MMKLSKNNRRQFIKNVSAGMGALYLPALARSEDKPPEQKKKIVCVGGHPDDPESGCGGSLAKFALAGNAVTIIYLTTGEAGIEGKSHDEAGAIRKQEALNACKVLNTNAVFARQVDGDTVMNNDWVNKMHDLIN